MVVAIDVYGAFGVKSSEMPKSPRKVLPVLRPLQRCGREATTATAVAVVHIIENFVCHFGSSTYELRNES